MRARCGEMGGCAPPVKPWPRLMITCGKPAAYKASTGVRTLSVPQIAQATLIIRGGRGLFWATDLLKGCCWQRRRHTTHVYAHICPAARVVILHGQACRPASTDLGLADGACERNAQPGRDAGGVQLVQAGQQRDLVAGQHGLQTHGAVGILLGLRRRRRRR